MVAKSLVNPRGVALEHRNLPQGELVHGRILGDREV